MIRRGFQQRKLWSRRISNAVALQKDGEKPVSGGVDGASLLPKDIVSELNRFVVGQNDAKRAVAIALRNRWRRRQLSPELAAEVIPKNILMIGPTGCGKTEIARRLAKLCDAPFIKVEATKFTEVGFHGRDVDQIIRDLVDISVNEVTERARRAEREKLKEEIEERLLDLLTGQEARGATRDSFREMLRSGVLEDREVEFEVPERQNKSRNGLGGDPSGNMENVIIQFQSLFPTKKQKRRMTLAECRPYVEEQETEKVLNKDQLVKRALQEVQENAVVFIDEVDKICTKAGERHGAEASAEGVQKDLLPLCSGTTINTKYGNVETDKILFIASGAFHSVKPSDLLPELQGRFPIRVQLKNLKREDYYRILTETEHNLIDQTRALLKTEEIDIEFLDEALKRIAQVTEEVNETVENIGARRLQTIMERIVEEISFECKPGKALIDVAHVNTTLSDSLVKTDLTRFVL